MKRLFAVPAFGGQLSYVFHTFVPLSNTTGLGNLLGASLR
jgi:hypothetical protein